MPFVQRIVSPTNLNYLTQEKQQQPLVVINDEETTTNVDENDRNRYIVVQFVNLVRQIADVARHSENILMQIFNDSLSINERWQRLEKRMEAIKTNVDGLNANAVEIGKLKCLTVNNNDKGQISGPLYMRVVFVTVTYVK